MPLELLDNISELPAWTLGLGGLWLLSMIAVPILRWTVGESGERTGIVLGVLFQAIAVFAFLLVSEGAVRALVVLAVCAGAGFLIELVGSRTGVPFGRYSYTERLKPQLAHVPLVVPAAWFMMLPPAWAIASLIAPGESRILFAAISGLAFAAWDFYLDPQMVHWDFWRWRDSGPYYGIPWTNFVGWFLGAFVISLLVGAPPVSPAPFFAVFALTWLLEAVAQLVFWRLILSGIVGFILMGVFVLLSLV
jgi:putative membrane protein